MSTIHTHYMNGTTARHIELVVLPIIPYLVFLPVLKRYYNAKKNSCTHLIHAHPYKWTFLHINLLYITCILSMHINIHTSTCKCMKLPEFSYIIFSQKNFFLSHNLLRHEFSCFTVFGWKLV